MADLLRTTNARLPLDGIRILAFEQYGAGPWCTMNLADLGAEVIKVENPSTGGDIARYVPPYNTFEDSLYFQSFNRNKKSITLNLQHPEADKVLHPLVSISDCVFNNLRGDLPGKLGLDYASLSKVKPSIVCCSLSAFGKSGPKSTEPGYDYIMQATAGWMSLTGDPEGPPQKSGLSMVDFSAGMMAAVGMLSAVIRARDIGLGGDVDVNLFDSAIAHLSYLATWHLTEGYKPKRWPNSSHPSQVPSQILPTSDGYIMVMCAKEKFFINLVSIMGAPELSDDSRFNNFTNRLHNRHELGRLLEQLSKNKTTKEWLRLFQNRVPSGPVNSVEEALNETELSNQKMIIELNHPHMGVIRQTASPINIGNSTIVHKPGPALGQHTDEVLQNYSGASNNDLKHWRKEGVI